MENKGWKEREKGEIFHMQQRYGWGGKLERYTLILNRSEGKRNWYMKMDLYDENKTNI